MAANRRVILIDMLAWRRGLACCRLLTSPAKNLSPNDIGDRSSICRIFTSETSGGRLGS